jgi:predicted HTH domain antitoxin
MNSMTYSIGTGLLLVLTLYIPVVITAQTSPPPRGSRTASSLSKKSKRSPDRPIAILVLDSTIDELPEVEDIQARVELAESIVKLLAKSRPEHCRRMLNALFNDAIALRRTTSSDNNDSGLDPDSILRKIIQITASFDRELSDSYIERYEAKDGVADKETPVSIQSRARTAELRLKLAIELIEKDPTLAVSLANESLISAIIPETLVFLGALRQKNVPLANNFFGAALQSSKTRRGSDISELILLYSYVFSPDRVPALTAHALGVYQIPAYASVAERYPVDVALARQFLNVSAQILLEPTRYYPGNVEGLAAGVIGDFYLINLIEPEAARYLPALATSLSIQKNVLAGYLPPDQNAESQASIERWNTMPTDVSLTTGGNVATVDYLLQRAEQASDSGRKDQLYYRAAMTALKAKQQERAFELVEKLSAGYRDEARQFLLFDIAAWDARHEQLDKAELSAQRDTDLARRAYVFTLIANSLLVQKSKDITRANEFLNKVEQLASRLNSPQERLSILVGAANVYSLFDTFRASEMLKEVIRVANKLEVFTGDFGIARVLDINGFYVDYSMYVDNFTLFDLINQVGLNNFNATLLDIREIKRPLLRLRAVVALCKGVLSSVRRD